MFKNKIPFSYIVQTLFSLAALITTFLSYYDLLWLDVTFLLISATFMTIAFNYYTIKHEKKMALFYFVLSISTIILLIFKVL